MKTVEFKIKYAKNEDIHQDGYVEIDEETFEWFYYDQQGFATPRQFTHHDGIGLTATDEQYIEISKFLDLVNFEFVEFVEEVILFTTKTDYGVYQKGDVIVETKII